MKNFHALCLSLGPSIFSKVEVIEISHRTQQSFLSKEADGIIVILSSGIPRSKSLSAEELPTVKQIWVLFGANELTPGYRMCGVQ